MYRPLRPHRLVTLVALLALPLGAVADDDDDEDDVGISACELCDELTDLARDCAREFGEGHVNDVVCDALATTETAACPQPDEGEDTGDTSDTGGGTARDGDDDWGDDDDDDDDDGDGECDCDDEHEEDHDHDCDDEDDNRVCADQCGEVQGLIDACVAELGPGHDFCEELQEIADECAQNPVDTGDTGGSTARIRTASCDVMGAAGGGGLIGAIGLLGLWMRRRR